MDIFVSGFPLQIKQISKIVLYLLQKAPVQHADPSVMESTGASDTLKQQFRMLQEQQQKRLMLRLQRKEEKEKNNKSNSAQNSTPNYSGNEFGVSDTLNLKVKEFI